MSRDDYRNCEIRLRIFLCDLLKLQQIELYVTLLSTIQYIHLAEKGRVDLFNGVIVFLPVRFHFSWEKLQ